MSIVLVGGHDRMHSEYKEVCNKSGHDIKILTQMQANFNKKIGSPDGIIIFTSTVSHKMVKTATTEAKKSKIPIIRSHSSSKCALKNKIEELEGMMS